MSDLQGRHLTMSEPLDKLSDRDEALKRNECEGIPLQGGQDCPPYGSETQPNGVYGVQQP